jgi:hypothetical protein
MARPGLANSQRARRSGDFIHRRQQDMKVTTSRRLMVTGLLCVLPMLFGDDARRRDAVNDLSLT